MSLLHMKHAIDAEGLSQTEKLVLIIICEYVNPDTGECWPSQATVAAKAGLTRETVSRICRALQDKGFLIASKQRRTNGSHSSNRMMVFPPKKIVSGEGVNSPCDAGSHGDNRVTQDHTADSQNTPSHVTEDHTVRDAGSHGHVTEDHTQNLPSINTTLRAAAREAGPDWKIFDTAVREILGDVVDMTRPDMHSVMPLRQLLIEHTGSPACTEDEILEASRKAKAICSKRSRQLRSWAMIVDIAIEYRDARILGHPIKPDQPKPVGVVDVSGFDHDKWRSLIMVSNARGGDWKPDWGPRPGSDGSHVPADLASLWKGE